MLAQLRSLKISPLVWAALGGLLLIVLAAFAGVVPRYYFGEEFLLFRYADHYAHNLAWRLYFADNGRVVEALYWNYLYEIFDYNPWLAHTLSFVLLLLGCLLAAKVFLNVWPQQGRFYLLPYAFVTVLFFNWISLPMAFKISTDNGRISLILFFLAGLALQRWAVGRQISWLFLGLGLFLLSVFTYENVLLLFPALLILAWPLVAKSQGSSRPMLWRYLGLAALSGLFALLPYLYYTMPIGDEEGFAHPALNAGSPIEMATRVLQVFPQFILRIGYSGQFAADSPGILLTLAVVLTLVLATLAFVKQLRSKPSPDRQRFLAVFLASLWMFLLGFLPYLAAGYGSQGRVYSSSVFGLFPLFLLAAQYWKQATLRVLAVLILLVFLGFSAFETVMRFEQIDKREASENILYRGLKQVVPTVQSDTVFIFIDRTLSNSGCGPSLEMLYNQTDIHCAFLSSTLEEYWAIRHESILQANRGGYLRKQNWILIAFDEKERPYLVEKLEPGDFDLLITWEGTAPIETDMSRIGYAQTPPSAFYRNILKRQTELGLDY